MSDPQLVCPGTPRTAPEGGSGSGPARRFELPPDLLKQASSRISITAGVISVTYFVAWMLGRAITPEVMDGSARWTDFDGRDLISVGSIALSLALWRHARKIDCDPHQMLDLALAYMVTISLGLGLMTHWMKPPQNMPLMPMLSWIGPIVLIFAAIVPSTPGKTLVAALLAVSMNPLAMLIARSRGVWDGSWTIALLMHYPDYLLVPIAVVMSRVVMGLREQVATAREMGSYQLGERIGAGAMGEVYRAKHRMFARPAAIKLIRPDAVAPGDVAAALRAVKRFRREAEAAAQLRSPHTVALYDFGVTSDQTLYFVMELLDGHDLQSMVREHGPLPPNRVIYILRQVCDSLEEAHASGLVHRDIKPANIHIGRVGLKHDFVKVLDFGLVKSLDPESADLESLASLEGASPGTPAYMAPEAIRGDALDGRADLYSLGCVGYYLLTGRLVFEAESGLKMIACHLQDRPTPPSKRAQAVVPPALDALILRCLEKDPENRPDGADEVIRALKAIPIEPWTQAEAIAWWQRHDPEEKTEALAS